MANTPPPPAPPIGPLIGHGNVAEVYRYGDAALKLYRETEPKHAPFREAANLALLETTGLPVPKVMEVGQYANRWGLVITRSNESSVATSVITDPARTDAFLQNFATLHARIHAAPANGFPGQKARLADGITRTTDLPEDRKSTLLARLSQMPDGDHLCHGDFHPLNVLGHGDTTMIIDWLDASRGNPAADICRSFVLLHGFSPDLARKYVAAGISTSSLTDDEIAEWLPFVAAARLSENNPDERDTLLHWAITDAPSLNAQP